MDAFAKLGRILDVRPALLAGLSEEMAKRTGKTGVFEKIAEENERRMEEALEMLGPANRSAPYVRGILKKAVLLHETQLLNFLEIVEGKTRFEKAARLARRVSKVSAGFFLKRSFAEKILGERPPQHLLEYLGRRDVDDLLAHHDVLESMSALRFVETDEWMHETFDAVYSSFTPDDFEEREIEVKVLGAEWHEIAEKFVAKKHHNVSHLKEFGVVFVNPIKENVAGKFLRDFALLLHYFHEIAFYSKLFARYSKETGFAERLKALLRGDVREVKEARPGEWLIVQRYLFKENPADPRLFLPRVNPESMHWLRGERDLALMSGEGRELDLKLWHDLDWVGGVFEDDGGKVVSFDLEDNAMSAVAFSEGKDEYFSYHQREAIWTKLFAEYAGGEEAMERALVEHFEKGAVVF